MLDAATLRCPAEKTLRLRERRPLPNVDVRLLYSAREVDCRACSLAERCLARGAAATNPRRVSALQRLVGRYAHPNPPPAGGPAPPALGSAADPPPRALLWGDTGGRHLRRDWVRQLRRQRVTIERLADRPATRERTPHLWTRAERAHRRLTWTASLTRNALPIGAMTSRVTLFGIPTRLAEFLCLPSAAAT